MYSIPFIRKGRGGIIIILLLFTLLPACKAETRPTYSIAVQLSNATGIDKLYLQAYRGFTLNNIDSLSFSTNTKNIFSGNNVLQPGMYALIYANKPLVNFFISDTGKQDFTISLNLNKLPQSITFTNSPENQAFINYLRFMGEQSQSQNAQAAVKQKQTEIIQQFPNSMLALFIQTMQVPEIPEPIYPVANRQEYAMSYYVNHFFDNVDFSDQRLLHTPLLEQKLGNYFKQMVPPIADTINERIKIVLDKASANNKIYNWTIQYLYNFYREAPIPENTEVYNFIGENYILTIPGRWDDSAFVEKVKTRVLKSKLNPIGEKTTNLILQTPEGKTRELYNVKADYTILFFYNPECEACQPVSQTLATKYRKFKNKGIEVFAVYMDNKKEEWRNYIATKNLTWINVYDPTGYKAEIEEKYYLYAIPMIYLLDKDKKVIAKDIMVNNIETYIHN